ncbi:zinc finger protein ZFP2-like [Anopheles darlingi]|uniref:zinc finger protein ZFP2-like n=1 Tax=Anopheles darlingi TaxID=43151 RepID=UPI0021006227|nr:zinc finger protein ZFP2-like [Anopheles darlingi]
MSLQIDMNSVCRICLSESDPSLSLFHIFTDTIVDGTLVAFPYVIEFCLGLKLGQDVEGAPSKVCQACRSQLFQFYIFKQKSHRTDKLIQSLLQTEPQSTKVELCAVKENTFIYELSEELLSDSEETPSMAAEPNPGSLVYDNEEFMLEDELIEESTGLDTSKSLEQNGDSLENESHMHLPATDVGDEGTEDDIESSNAAEDDIESSATPSYACSPIKQVQLISVVPVPTVTETKELKCEICATTHPSRGCLKRHMRKHRNANILLEHMSFYSCEVCHSLYLNEEERNEHYQACANSFANNDEILSERGQHLDDGGGLCGVCNVSYVNSEMLKHHMVLTHLGKFSCPFADCGCEYNSMAPLALHITNKHIQSAETTRCLRCKEEITRGCMEQHLESGCKAIPQFDCMHCDKKFLSSRALAQHLKQLEQRFQCEVCEKSFAALASLRSHQLTHTGEKPFLCTVCGKSFTTASHRTAHMDTHIKGKLFECDLCGKCLQSRACYRNHVKRHRQERSHRCDICGKMFYSKYSVRVHQQEVHKMKNVTQADEWNEGNRYS